MICRKMNWWLPTALIVLAIWVVSGWNPGDAAAQLPAADVEPTEVSPAPSSPNLLPLLKALEKRDWPSVTNAFDKLGVNDAADALEVIFGRTLSVEPEVPLLDEPDEGASELLSNVENVLNASDYRLSIEGKVSLLVRMIEEYKTEKNGKPKPSELEVIVDHRAAAFVDFGTEVNKIVTAFDHHSWLRLIDVFPFSLRKDVLTNLGSKLLYDDEIDRDAVFEDVLKFVAVPSRHFGPANSEIAKRLRSAMLLMAINNNEQAQPFLPSVREMMSWPEIEANKSGLDKSSILRTNYLTSWAYDGASLRKVAPDDVLELLVSDLDYDDYDGAKVVMQILDLYGTSENRSLRITDRIAEKPALAAAVSNQAASQASREFESAIGSLNDFLRTNLSQYDKGAEKWVDMNVNQGKDENLQRFRISVQTADRAVVNFRRLSRSIYQAAEDPLKLRSIAEQAADVWLELCSKHLDSYSNYDKPPAHNDEEILLPIARSEAYAVGRLRGAAPTPEMFAALSPAKQLAFRETLVRVAGMESDYNTIIRLCEDAAAANRPSHLRRVVIDALNSWVLPVKAAGRSPQARVLMSARTPEEFGEFAARLRDIVGAKTDEELIFQTFTKFCVQHRPLSLDDMKAVLPVDPAPLEKDLQAYVSAMLWLLNEDRDLTAKANRAEKDALLDTDEKKKQAQKAKTEAAEDAVETSGEYEALDAIVAAWYAKHPTSWVGALLQARIQFTWAHHELQYVEAISKGAKTNVAGFSAHLDHSMKLMQQAAELCAQTAKNAEGDYESLALASAWFHQTYQFRAERATKQTSGDEVIGQIIAWLDRLPAAERMAVRQTLALELLRQLFPPNGKPQLKDIEIYYFVTGAVDVLGDIPEATEFQRLKAGYDKLRQAIRFAVVPEGKIYTQGDWAGSQKRSFPVGGGEFGAWLTLQHTREAYESSGGFRRYTENQIENLGQSLDARAEANYANDMEKRLAAQLEGQFAVVKISPLPKVKKLRDLRVGGKDDSNAGTQWQETPLFYMILKPAGGVSQTRIPQLPIDLNFVDDAGMYVLPFSSEPVDLDPTRADQEVAKDLKVIQRLMLRDNNTIAGVVELEITTTGGRVPPHAATLFPDLYSPGFEKSGTEETDALKVLFESRPPYVTVSRFAKFPMQWHGVNRETDFQFPSAGAISEQNLQRLVWYPGILGDSAGNGVQGDVYTIRGLPHGRVPWEYGYLIAVGLFAVALLALLVRKLPKRVTRLVTPIPYQLPPTVSPLRSIHVLRRMVGDHALNLSRDQRADLRADIHSLEEASLAINGDGEHCPAAADTLRRWIEAAQQAQTQTTN